VGDATRLPQRCQTFGVFVLRFARRVVSGVSPRTYYRAAPLHSTAQACAVGTPALSLPENRGRRLVV